MSALSGLAPSRLLNLPLSAASPLQSHFTFAVQLRFPGLTTQLRRSGALLVIVWPTGDYRSRHSLGRELFARYSPEVLLMLADKELHRRTPRNVFDMQPFVPRLPPPTESNTIRHTLSAAPRLALIGASMCTDAWFKVTR